MKKTIFFITIILAFTFFVSLSYAQMSQGLNRTITITPTPSQRGATVREEVRNTILNKGEESALRINEKLQQRLEGAKLRVCQQRTNTIKIRSANIVRHINKQVEVFDKILGRTVEFYEEKILAKGESIEGYDDLVAKTNQQREDIAPLIYDIEEMAKNFKCESEDPMNKLNEFGLKSKGIISEMQEYKRSIRDLIVAVKTHAGTAKSTVTVVPTKTN